jgi:hypothetical protein
MVKHWLSRCSGKEKESATLYTDRERGEEKESGGREGEIEVLTTWH